MLLFAVGLFSIVPAQAGLVGELAEDAFTVLVDVLFPKIEPKLAPKIIEAFDNASKALPKSTEKTFSALDGQADQLDKQALKTILRSDETAHHIGIEKWEFVNPPTLLQLEAMMTLARTKLPGKVELAPYLDPKVFRQASKSIVDAWGNRPVSEPPVFQDLISDYLSARSGNTLLVVGHVQDRAFVVETQDGKEARIDIGNLLIEARKHNVALIPIGCSTALAAAIGFVQEIGTDSVSSFLKSFPQDNPLTGDLLSGLTTIGDVRVDINLAASMFDVQVYVDKSPGISARIPYNLAASSISAQQNQPSLNKRLDMEADQFRPAYAKSWVLALCRNPSTYLSLLLSLFASSWAGSGLMKRWAYEHRSRQKLYRIVRYPWSMLERIKDFLFSQFVRRG